MERILKAFAPGTVHLGWYVNETLGVRLTSEAALPMLASDYFCNLEVWTSIQNVGAGLSPAPLQTPPMPQHSAKPGTPRHPQVSAPPPRFVIPPPPVPAPPPAPPAPT